MTPLETNSAPAEDLPIMPVARLSVQQYHDMIRAGILSDDDRVELLEGWLVTQMSKNPPHSVATELAREALAKLLAQGWTIRTQEPITTQESEPEPDLAVARGERRTYSTRHPTPAEVALVIEVADTTLQRDRTDKKRIYARAGIAIYWIINLVNRQIEVYGDPTGPVVAPDYRLRQDFHDGDTVPVWIEGQQIGWLAVRDLLP